jgi:hypothetical protein
MKKDNIEKIERWKFYLEENGEFFLVEEMAHSEACEYAKELKLTFEKTL